MMISIYKISNTTPVSTVKKQQKNTVWNGNMSLLVYSVLYWCAIIS